MRRPVGVKSILHGLHEQGFVLPPSGRCRHASIRTLEERFISLGACWALSVQPVLPSLWRPVVLVLQSGTWAARRAESVRSFLLSCFARPWPPARAIRSRYFCAVSTLMSLGFHHQVELCDDENAMTFVVRAYINAYSRLSFKDIGREGLSRGHHRETSRRRLQQAHCQF